MNWGFVILMILGILGAGLVVGGFVAYRGTGRTGLKAFAAAAVASGMVMWATVIVTLPVSAKYGDGPREPVVVVEPIMNTPVEER